MFKNTMIIEYVCINNKPHFIAVEEIKAISEIFKISIEFVKISEGFIIIKAPLFFAYLLIKRMSLLKRIIILFNDVDELYEFLVNHHVKKIRIEGDAEFSKEILKELSEFIISLDEPDITIYVSNEGKLGVIFQGNRRQFLKRNPPYRPYSPPYTMDSFLSRLAVNLSRAFPGCLFFDPFCGSGSFLLEAYFVGCYPIGVDISLPDLIGARYNLKFFGADAILIASDSTRRLIAENSIDSIATDPPYGRASRVSKYILKLYNDFLTVSYNVLKSGRYLVFFHPSILKEVNKIIEQIGFRYIFTFPIRAHKSLIRNLTILRV